MPTKTPQDHLPKKTTTEAVDRTVEVQGLTLTIAADSLNDFELLDDLAALDSGDANAALRMPRVLRGFVGAEQYRQVMDHLRDAETRRVSIDAGVEFIGDLIGALNPN